MWPYKSDDPINLFKTHYFPLVRYSFEGVGEYWKIIKLYECKSSTEIYLKTDCTFQIQNIIQKLEGRNLGRHSCYYSHTSEMSRVFDVLTIYD